MSADQEYLWVARWDDFQHYRPRRERGPAWIKTYTAQLSDERYLALNSKQRSVLQDLRMLFPTLRQLMPNNTRMLSGLICQRVTKQTLEALNHAGFIEFISREVLEQRLEVLYRSSRAEVYKEEEEPETEEQQHQGSSVSLDQSNTPSNVSSYVRAGGSKNDTALVRLLALATTPQDQGKLARAALHAPEYWIVDALEAATLPGAIDPIACAIARLKWHREGVPA